MKSVGEVMAIGRTFKESLQKACARWKSARTAWAAANWGGGREILPRDEIERKLITPCAERIFYIRHAFRAGFTLDDIYLLTKIDRWFLLNIKEIVDMEEELVKAGKLEALV